jgi:hypothetical protein
MSSPLLGPDEIRALSKLLDEALGLSDAEREVWLSNLGEPDARLVPQLRAMLARGAEISTGRTLPPLPRYERADLAVGRGDAAGLEAGSAVGPYRLIRELDGRPYLALEYVEGEALTTYANRGELDRAGAARGAILRTVPGYSIAQVRAKHYSDVPEYASPNGHWRVRRCDQGPHQRLPTDASI